MNDYKFYIQILKSILLISILYTSMQRITIADVSIGNYGGEPNLILSVNLVNKGCTLSSSSENILVTLGQWAGSFNKIGLKSPLMPFNINIENCKNVNAVDVAFSYVAIVNNDPTLLQLDNINSLTTAKNVAVFISNEQGEAYESGRAYRFSNLGAKTSYSLPFYAGYIVTALPVRAGTANASAQFTISYP